MRGGFRRLLYPGTPVQEIDVEGTREQRQLINEHIRQQQKLIDQLRDEPIPTPKPDTNDLR